VVREGLHLFRRQLAVQVIPERSITSLHEIIVSAPSWPATDQHLGRRRANLAAAVAALGTTAIGRCQPGHPKFRRRLRNSGPRCPPTSPRSDTPPAASSACCTAASSSLRSTAPWDRCLHAGMDGRGAQRPRAPHRAVGVSRVVRPRLRKALRQIVNSHARQLVPG
jgi:hypothetical protein